MTNLQRYTVESSYERPDDFIPERWYSKPEMVKNQAGFAPFSSGMSEIQQMCHFD